MLKTPKLFHVLKHLIDSIDDAVDIFLAAKEEMMRKPDGLVICGTLGGRALVHVSQIERLRPSPAQCRIVRRVDREERTSINRLVKKPVARYSFQLKCRNECSPRDILDLLRVVLQHITVRSESRNTRLGLEQSDALRATQPRFEVLHVRLTSLGLLGKPLQLRVQHRRLE